MGNDGKASRSLPRKAAWARAAAFRRPCFVAAAVQRAMPSGGARTGAGAPMRVVTPLPCPGLPCRAEVNHRRRPFTSTRCSVPAHRSRWVWPDLAFSAPGMMSFEGRIEDHQASRHYPGLKVDQIQEWVAWTARGGGREGRLRLPKTTGPSGVRYAHTHAMEIGAKRPLGP